MKTNPDRAVVVFSGGQDSTTILALARNRHAEVYAIAFDYGQMHAVELEQAAKIAELLEVHLTIFEMPALAKMTSSALVNHGDVSAEHLYLDGRPASFVPARNAAFIVAAWGYAMELQAQHIYVGVCQTDYSGYPDCREEFIIKLQDALRVGYEADINIHAPLMHLTKAQTFAMAEEEDALRIVVEHSHTCYNGDRDTAHDWGKGCGHCPACTLREKGWVEYQASRPKDVQLDLDQDSGVVSF